jgi:hypothetical protein
MSYTRIPVENDKNLEIFTIEDFLTDEECDHLCDHILKHNARSQVAGYGNEASVVMDNRTSSTSTLTDNDPIVKNINEVHVAVSFVDSLTAPTSACAQSCQFSNI